MIYHVLLIGLLAFASNANGAGQLPLSQRPCAILSQRTRIDVVNSIPEQRFFLRNSSDGSFDAQLAAKRYVAIAKRLYGYRDISVEDVRVQVLEVLTVAGKTNVQKVSFTVLNHLGNTRFVDGLYVGGDVMTPEPRVLAYTESSTDKRKSMAYKFNGAELMIAEPLDVFMAKQLPKEEVRIIRVMSRWEYEHWTSGNVDTIKEGFDPKVASRYRAHHGRLVSYWAVGGVIFHEVRGDIQVEVVVSRDDLVKLASDGHLVFGALDSRLLEFFVYEEAWGELSKMLNRP